VLYPETLISVPFSVIDFVPLSNSDTVTVIGVPLIVPPSIYPVVFVTLGVTVTEWLDTVPFVATGVPAVPLVTDLDAATE